MATRLPGVVVRIVPDIGRPTLPAFPRYVCVIGQGEHRLLVRNEAVVRGSGDVDLLMSVPVEEILMVGDSPDRSDYLLNTDYEVYVRDGVRVGIKWKELIPAVVGPGVSEPFDFTVKSWIVLDVDGRGAIRIRMPQRSDVTASEVVAAINSALVHDARYGDAYGSVASVVDGRVRLTSVVLGVSGSITIYPDELGCEEIIFGDLDGDGDTGGLESEYQVRGQGRARPQEGYVYYVTYRYTAPDATYEPQLYFDLGPLMRDHGELFLGDPTRKLNPIVAMAKLAFQDHPERIPGLVVIQLDLRNAVDPYNPTIDELRAAYNAVIDKLERITYGKLYLVADTTDSVIINALLNHVKRMSNPEIKAERMLIISLPAGSTVQDYVEKAQTYFSERVMLFYPPEINATIDVSYKFRLPGYYGGLVYAARKTALPVGRPINMEPLANLDLVGKPLTYNEKRALLGAGVAVIDYYGGRVVILHGITTRTDFVILEEENVVDIADYVKAVWRQRLEQIFLNRPIDEGLLRDMVVFSGTLLDSMIRDRILSDYKDVSAVQDESDPRMVRVRGRVKPMFHTLYIDVEFVFATVL